MLYSSKDYAGDVRCPLLFPDLLIAELMHFNCFSLMWNCRRLTRVWSTDTPARQALSQPYKQMLDSIETYLLCVADTWLACSQVCEAYIQAITLLADPEGALDTHPALKTHFTNIRQQYDAVLQHLDDHVIAGERALESVQAFDDSITRYLASAPLLRRIVRCLDPDWHRQMAWVTNIRNAMEHLPSGLLTIAEEESPTCEEESNILGLKDATGVDWTNTTGVDMKTTIVDKKNTIVDRENTAVDRMNTIIHMKTPAIVDMKNAITDMTAALPKSFAEMQALAPAERRAVRDEIIYTQCAVIRWVEVDQRRAKVLREWC
ncbi:hypothetical protein BD626DRAFT_503570 [Schizophyllum amplum]|uniref:Uncharacterized protein n=1 Tax=Schizophyllum amplum TaxID=97359 RepID=A0A550C7D6_9AGAR|nr:hypothetical protein BD626DRAFT_503570 [Auriculariopsis ampla]